MHALPVVAAVERLQTQEVRSKCARKERALTPHAALGTAVARWRGCGGLARTYPGVKHDRMDGHVTTPRA